MSSTPDDYRGRAPAGICGVDREDATLEFAVHLLAAGHAAPGLTALPVDHRHPPPAFLATDQELPASGA